MAKNSSSSNRVYIEAHRTSYVSQSGVIAVLKAVREHGLPEAISRQTLKRTRVSALPRDTPLGPLFKDVEVTMHTNNTMKVPCVSPLPLLWHSVRSCTSFSEWFWEKAQNSNISTPLRIALYCDEVLPGDALKATNHRKMVCWYWTILEYGHHCSREELWMHLLTLRTVHVKKIAGGYSQLFRRVVELFHTAPFDARLGVSLHFHGVGERYVFLSVDQLVADEVALRQAWSVKGSAGTLCCLFCQNVCNYHVDLDFNSRGELVPSYITSLRTARQHTDESIKEAAVMLNAQRPNLNKTQFDGLEKSLGLTWCEEGALYDPQFWNMIKGPVSVTSFDWMHCYFVNGSWSSEAGLLLDVLRAEHGFEVPGGLVQYMDNFQWPQKVSSRSLTGQKAVQAHKSGPLSCSASEGLALYPMIRSMLVELFPSPTAGSSDAIGSYFALCKVLDLLVESRCRDVSPFELNQSIERRLEMRLKAYSHKAFQPKNHYTLHLPHTLHKNKILLSCWALERKHRELKRHGNAATNANKKISWERGLLQEVVLTQFLELQNWDPKEGVILTNPHEASTELTNFVVGFFWLTPADQLEVLAATSALCDHEQIGKGDVVVSTRNFVGVVWFHMHVRSQQVTGFYTVLSKWESLGGNRFRICNNPSIALTNELVKSLPFRKECDLALVVP